MELKAKRNRKYEDLEIGDKVKIMIKKEKNFKERLPLYSTKMFEIENIKKEDGLKLYDVNNKLRTRNEILK